MPCHPSLMQTQIRFRASPVCHELGFVCRELLSCKPLTAGGTLWVASTDRSCRLAAAERRGAWLGARQGTQAPTALGPKSPWPLRAPIATNWRRDMIGRVPTDCLDTTLSLRRCISSERREPGHNTSPTGTYIHACMHAYVRACVHTRTQGHADARKHNVHKCAYVCTCMRENLPSII